jgi:hypothetical protein
MRSFVMVTAMIALSAPLALAGCVASPDDGNTDEAQQADKGFYAGNQAPTALPAQPPSTQLPPVSNIGPQPLGPQPSTQLPVGGNVGPQLGGPAPVGNFGGQGNVILPPQAGMSCSPVEGQPPQYVAPSFEAPQYPAPTFGAPNYSPPVYKAPTYNSPNYQAPSMPQEYGAPSYNAPSYAGPTFRAPVYEAPTYEAPTFLAPIYLPPNYEQPHGLLAPNPTISCGCACNGNENVGNTMPIGNQGIVPQPGASK